MVAMRYHAMLFATRTGVPLIPISYADKTERWITAQGLHSVEADAHDLVPAIRSALITAPRRSPRLLRTAS